MKTNYLAAGAFVLLSVFALGQGLSARLESWCDSAVGVAIREKEKLRNLSAAPSLKNALVHPDVNAGQTSTSPWTVLYVEADQRSENDLRPHSVCIEKTSECTFSTSALSENGRKILSEPRYIELDEVVYIYEMSVTGLPEEDIWIREGCITLTADTEKSRTAVWYRPLQSLQTDLSWPEEPMDNSWL